MMATADKVGAAPAASVDYLVDENASAVDVPDDSKIRPADEIEDTVGATGPTNWWMMGLIALAIVAAILLGLQLLNGTPGTDVQPGTPVAAPEITAPAPNTI
jgi:hypothetical protein